MTSMLSQVSAKTQNTQMKAIYAEDYGPPGKVLTLKHLPIPQIHLPDHVLIKVRAASVHAGDWRLIRAAPFIIRFMYGGICKPSIHIPGCDVCGVVEQVGSGVSDVKEGDQVFGDVSEVGFGAFAEYIVVPRHAVVHKPEGVSVKHAAVSGVSALAALQAVKKGQVQGKRVLINGASGGVGTFAVQFAKHYGAKEVTAVCRGSKGDVLRSLGASSIIDYTEEDVYDVKRTFDVVIDIACFDSPRRFTKMVSSGGQVIVVGGSFPRFLEAMLISAWVSRTQNVQIEVLESKPNQDDLKEIASLLCSGDVVPHIDQEFKLEDVPEALGLVESRKVTGKVLINM